MIFFASTVAAQQPHGVIRLCDPVNGLEKPYSIDEVEGHLLITGGSYPTSFSSYAVCSFLLDSELGIISKDYVIYDSVDVVHGYRGSSIVVGDSLVLAGAVKWETDSFLPAITHVALSGEISDTKLLPTGVEIGDFYDVAACEDGGMLLFGSTTTDSGYVDFVATRISESGEIEWVKSYGTEYWDRGFSVCRGPEGGYFLGGESYGVGHIGRPHILIIRVDSNGKEIWRGDWGGRYDDSFGSIEYNPDVGLLFAGSLSKELGDEGPAYAAYTMLINENGELMWDQYFNQDQGDTASFGSLAKGKFIGNDRILVVGKGAVFDIQSAETRPIAMILDHDGEVLMKRIYTSFIKEKSFAWFEDFEQLQDGRIITTGVYLPDTTNGQDTGNQDILIVELDEHGCEYPGCQPPIGLEEISDEGYESSIHVFPNPSSTSINIICSETIRSWSVSTIDGRVIRGANCNAGQLSIDLSSMSTGMYILNVRGSKNQWTERIVKQ